MPKRNTSNAGPAIFPKLAWRRVVTRHRALGLVLSQTSRISDPCHAKWVRRPSRVWRMAKGSRSKTSATPATRKKHAAASAAKRGEASEPKAQPAAPKPGKPNAPGQPKKKLSKKERKALAKKKAWVPPPKPPKQAPYPLDSMGLASLLPPDLVVLLRKALKKDIITRVRTLESLLAWIQGRPQEAHETLSVEERCEAIALMLPCWVYLFPRLALTPSQRIRQLTLQVHDAILAFPMPHPDASCVRDELLSYTHMASILGFWAVLSHDTSRTVTRLGMQVWKTYVAWHEPNAQPTKLSLYEYTHVLVDHLRPILLSPMPAAALAQMTPSLQITPASADGTELQAKNRDDAHVDENAEEVNGRLVAGALAVLHGLLETAAEELMPELDAFFESAQLWSALLSREALRDDDEQAHGASSPVTRQRAWSLLALLWRIDAACVDRHKDTILPLVMQAALAERDVAVMQDMLAVCLPLLRAYPSAWIDDEDENLLPQFQTWVQVMAPLVPAACFPAVIVFLSTMPPELVPHASTSLPMIMEPLLNLAQVLAQGMSHPRAWDAYMLMVCECLRFMVRRVAPDTEETRAYVADELQCMYSTMVLPCDALPLPERLRVKSARELGRCLAALGDSVPEGTLAMIHASIASIDVARDGPALTALLVEMASAGRADDALAHALLQRVLGAWEPSSVALLTQLLESDLRTHLTSGDLADSALLVATHLIPSHLASEAPDSVVSFYTAYLRVCAAPEAVWEALFGATLEAPRTVLPVLVRVARDAAPFASADRVRAWQHDMIPRLMAEPRAWLALLDAPPGTLLNQETKDTLIRTLIHTAQHVDASEQPSFLRILCTWIGTRPHEHALQVCADAEAVAHLVPLVWRTGYLRDQQAYARTLWTYLTDASEALYPQAVEVLQTELLHGTTPPRRIAAASRALPPALASQVGLSAEHLTHAMQDVAGAATSPLVAVHDPIVPLASTAPPLVPAHMARLLRYAEACIDVPHTLSVAQTLPPIALAAMLLEDALVIGDKMEHVFTSPRDAQACLVRLVHAVTRQLSSLAAHVSADWHTSAAAAMPSYDGRDALTALLHTVWTYAVRTDALSYARLWSRLLSGVLSLTSASSSEADVWVRACRTTSAPLACAVLWATRTRPTAAHARWRNELAADLSGVPSARANTDGVRLLHLLQCAAPPQETGEALIPTQRAIFVLQTLQRWVTSDDELDETVFALLATLFTHVAPVVQSVAGRHLDMMLDVVEENIHAVVLSEPAGWPTLLSTLMLLDTLYALRCHEHVQNALSAHRSALVGALHDAFVHVCAFVAASRPTPHDALDACTERLARLVDAHVPPERFTGPDDHDTLTRLVCTTTACQALQVAALSMLAKATHARVREQVVEMAVGSLSDAAVPQLSAPLVASLRAHAGYTPAVWADLDRHAVFSFLLQWLAVLDHFAEASLPLRTVFASELQTLLPTQLLPSVFVLISGVPRDVPALDGLRYALDEVDVAQLTPASVPALQGLAAHVYYRTLVHVPTQVRDWWMSLRDRQLSMRVAHFTSRFCTPVLAERELRHLRDPAALSRLQDESMSVRILASNEVVATYTVDEHPMEIGVRLPSDYPLHGVEIRDLKRVGVSEAQWRAWLLAVQQLLSGRNGLILDALTLFKKNAEAKFQGYEGAECAICYSIISPTDQSLPTKPCRTCKHKFHGSCLFKWVSTSGASTCPLCRSIL